MTMLSDPMSAKLKHRRWGQTTRVTQATAPERRQGVLGPDGPAGTPAGAQGQAPGPWDSFTGVSSQVRAPLIAMEAVVGSGACELSEAATSPKHISQGKLRSRNPPIHVHGEPTGFGRKSFRHHKTRRGFHSFGFWRVFVRSALVFCWCSHLGLEFPLREGFKLQF